MSAKRDRLARWLTGDGIEIGALHQPLAVPPGVRVTYVDHLRVEELRNHYPELSGLELTPVSVVGSAEDLSAFPNASLDFVIANHLVEHLEYPARGLLEFQRVLKPGGIAYLALPDKRKTFDRDRETTSVEHLIDEHQTHSAADNRRAHYLDWAEHVDGKEHGAEAARHADQLMAIPYSIHFHVWRPDAFLDFLAAARMSLGVQLQVLQFAGLETSTDYEFVLLLAKPGGPDPVLPPEDTAPEAAAITSELARASDESRHARRLRHFVGRTPLGPPLRALRRRLGP